MHEDDVRRVSRRLRNLVEPLAANVYFAAEAIDAYRELGLGYGAGYFCSRSAGMGRLSGEAVAAAFGVFNPAIVVPAVTKGWAATTPEAILNARLGGATASLTRILDGLPDGAARATELLRKAADAAPSEGRPIFSGLRSLGFPEDPMGDLWRAADLVREHRGDSHTAAWVTTGVDAVEITLLTERWWG
ncbi:MAG: SCO6745 family protein, partial [Acidimicrobiales bacterium]